MRSFLNSRPKTGWLAICVGASMTWTGCATHSSVNSYNEMPKKQDLSKDERARLIIELANGALYEGDPTGALQQLFEAEGLAPELPELHHSKALAFSMKHDLPDALISARRAVELKPDYPDANNTLGKLLVDAGHYDEAIKPLEIAAHNPLYRETYKAHTNLGILYYRKNQFKTAESEFDRAIVDSPQGSCIAYYYRGHLYLKAGQVPSAVKEYDHATQKFCSGFADAHLALAIALERNKQYDLARRKLLDIRQNFPNTKIAEQAMERLRYIP